MGRQATLRLRRGPDRVALSLAAKSLRNLHDNPYNPTNAICKI